MPKSYESDAAIISLQTKIQKTIDDGKKFKEIPLCDKPLWMAKRLLLWLCIEMLTGGLKRMNPIKIIQDIFGIGHTFANDIVNKSIQCM